MTAYDSSCNYKVLITAAHVAYDSDSNEYYDEIYQNDPQTGELQTLGTFDDACDGHLWDVAKFKMKSGVNTHPMDTMEDQQEDILGWWDYSGLAEETTGGKVWSNYAGRMTCLVSDYCVDVAKVGRDDSPTAYMETDATVQGDSGGPWVDGRGYLVMIHRGTDTKNRSTGTVAQNSLTDLEVHAYC